MAPKKSASSPGTPSRAASGTIAPKPSPARIGTASKGGAAKSNDDAADWAQVFNNLCRYYGKETPRRIKLIDMFLVFLLVNGALQFLYCVLAGTYPFNAFLAGFGASVGQFVFTVSLRNQVNEPKKGDFAPSITPERAFADFIACSFVMHFFCINFMN